jgi:hypothetical protein
MDTDIEKFKNEIARLKHAPVKSPYGDRECGLLIPNRNIADLKTLADDHTALKERLVEAEALVKNYRELLLEYGAAFRRSDGTVKAMRFNAAGLQGEGDKR